jgi:hypothetical protein
MPPKKSASAASKKASSRAQCGCYTNKNKRCSRKVYEEGKQYCKQHTKQCKHTSQRDLHSEVAKTARKIRSKKGSDKPKLLAIEDRKPTASQTAASSASKPLLMQAKTSPSGVVNKKAQAIGGSDVSSVLASLRKQGVLPSK